MSRFFRPPIGDPFLDSFWGSERGLFDTNFGSTVTEEYFIPSNYFVRRRPRGPWNLLMSPHSPITATQANPLEKLPTQPTGELMTQMNNAANDKYQIMVDVSHFNPEEISVKMVDNAIVVTGKHEDKADNYGYVSRQFSRKYLLPVDVEPESATSTLSADGILTIQATRKPLQINDSAAGRSVPIAISNQALSPVLSMVPPQFPIGQSMGTKTISVEQTQTSTTTSKSQEPINIPTNGESVAPPTTQAQPSGQ